MKLSAAFEASIALSFGDVSDAYQFFPSTLGISDNPDYRANLQHCRITDIDYKRNHAGVSDHVHELHLDDSLQHRAFTDGLVKLDEKAETIRQLDVPWLRQPLDAELDGLFACLEALWKTFDRQLRQDTAGHPRYQPAPNTLSLGLPPGVPPGTAGAPLFPGRPPRAIPAIFRLGHLRF